MGEMLKAFLLENYTWAGECEITDATVDVHYQDIDFRINGESTWVSGVDLEALLGFATNWSGADE